MTDSNSDSDSNFDSHSNSDSDSSSGFDLDSDSDSEKEPISEIEFVEAVSYILECGLPENIRQKAFRPQKVIISELDNRTFSDKLCWIDKEKKIFKFAYKPDDSRFIKIAHIPEQTIYSLFVSGSKDLTDERVQQMSLTMIEVYIRFIQRNSGNLNLIADDTESRTYQIISKEGACKDLEPEDQNVVLKTSIITRTHNFLNESLCHSPGRKVKTKYDEGILGLLTFGCSLKVFADGYGEENVGFVSILITFGDEIFDFEGYCIVSLIDSSNTERFLQSFTLPYPMSRPFCIEKFISRNSVLSNSDEFLPNGILTLKIDIELVIHFENYFVKNYRRTVLDLKKTYCFRSGDTDDYPIELNLDSNLGECLLKESSYFRRMLDTPMTEMRTRFMAIHKNEKDVFLNLCVLLLRHSFKTFSSINSIYDIYIFADKYDIPFVSEICKCLLKLLASAHKVDDFLSCIRDYEDDYLQELLLKQMALIYETNFKEEIFITDRYVSLVNPVHECFWSYEYTLPNYAFLCKTQPRCNSRKEQRDDYDFYK